MRALLLFRGSAGCGKSTYIEEHGLKPYTLCADDIRMMCSSPTLQPDGTVGINQANDKVVWNTLFRLLEIRMQNGEFTVIDATNSKTSEMNKYKELAKNYRYRIYCIDMTDIPIEETKRRNANREELKHVPDEAIEKMYSRFETQQIPSGIKVLKPNELDTIWYRPTDLSKYKKIHIIGDIHGCYTALKEYFINSYFDKTLATNNNTYENWHNKIIGQYDKDNKFLKAYFSAIEAEKETGIDNISIRKVCNHIPKYNTAGGYIWKNIDEMDLEDFIKKDSAYIFVGDYVDRGIENVEVVNWIVEQINYPNMIFLEGNHERWLWMWANDLIARSKEFEFITKPQLDAAKISKKKVRELYRKLGQCCYFTYFDKKFIVTHGGISNIPNNLLTIATEQMIKGVGRYNDADLVDRSFVDTTDNNTYQVHGHRNIVHSPVQTTDRTFNLEGEVEFGGCLRAIEIIEGGIITVEVKNEVFKEPQAEEESVTVNNNVDMSVYALVAEMRKNHNIYEKPFGRISSFNFTRQAFEKAAWDDIVNKARGLYIDTVDYKVVARAYNKFFNINERPETKLNNLRYKLQFPVTAYVKENGFLGIVGWNTETNDLLITSKSSPTGDFSGYLKTALYDIYGAEKIDKMKEYIIENNVSFVFECCDIEHDKHIIEYPESKVILLDVVKNQLDFEKLPYDELVELSQAIGLKVKEKACVIKSWEDFYDWYNEITSEDYLYNGEYIEGFVVEDSVGYMTKLKLYYYKFWKRLRSVAQSVLKYGNYKYTGSLLTPIENEFFGWCKNLYATLSSEDREEVKAGSYTNICDLRTEFFKWRKQKKNNTDI